jgi:TatD DNase family protein
MAREIIKLGMYIGIGGVVTFKNAKNIAEVVENISLSHIVLETDAPYMAPVPFRGKRCDSSLINYTSEKIAELKNTEVSEVLKITKENAMNLFLLK